MSKDLYNMKFGEIFAYDNNSSYVRVPGGWIYGDMQGTCFIPFSTEFQVLQSGECCEKCGQWHEFGPINCGCC